MACTMSCVTILVLGIVKAHKIQTATITPQEKSVEDVPSRRFTDFDSYQYQGFVGLPTSDVFTTILLAQEISKKHRYYDEDIDYQDNDDDVLLYDDIISDVILLESLVHKNLVDNPISDNSYSESSYFDGLLLDSGLTIKKPWKKSLKKPLMKRPKLQKSLSSYQRRKLIRDLKQLLKKLFPLVKESGSTKQARVQVVRRRGNGEPIERKKDLYYY